jgi:hypothetical protein
MSESKNEPDDGLMNKLNDQLNHWENFVQEQNQKRKEQASMLQDLLNESGLIERGLNPLSPEFAEIANDLEFQKQMSLHYGLKLDKGQPIDASKPDVSLWRQRTRALKV